MPERNTPLDPKGAHGIEHLLGVNGIRTNPDSIVLDPIRPVVEMSMGGHARIFDLPNELYNYQVISLGAGASSHVGEWIISYGNHQAIANADMVFNLNHSLRIIAVHYMVHIHKDAGGGSTLNNRSFRVDLKLERGAQEVSFWTATHDIALKAGDPFSMHFHYPGDWGSNMQYVWDANDQELDECPIPAHFLGSQNQIRCPIIPPSWGVKLHLNTNCLEAPDVGHWSFPVNSYAYVWILAQQVPIGAPIPGYWE